MIHIELDDGTVYSTWTDGRAIGFVVRLPGKAAEVIYLNPSDHTDGDGTPNVFLYHGLARDDPYKHEPVHHYELGDLSETT